MPFISGFQNIIFDCDSTLCAIEGVDFLARRKGVGDQVALLTAEAMNGNIEFEEVFGRRLALIKPSQKDLAALGQAYISNLTPGAIEVVRRLQDTGKKVFLVSGGYQVAISQLAQWLNIPLNHVWAVDLIFNDKGFYHGFNKNNILTRRGGKAIAAKHIRQTGKTLMIGDGFTDLEAQEYVDLFVGYGGVVCRPNVQKEAEFYFKTKSLLPVLYFALA